MPAAGSARNAESDNDVVTFLDCWPSSKLRQGVSQYLGKFFVKTAMHYYRLAAGAWELSLEKVIKHFYGNVPLG
jgi:hypothetical protein